MTQDYTEQLAEFWPTIMRAWDECGKRHPIIECDLVTRKVMAMPAVEYINGLTDRTRNATRRRYDKITSEGGMMVFVRDSKMRILQSYSFTLGDARGYERQNDLAQGLRSAQMDLFRFRRPAR
jgi:hypothetical protein